MPRRPDAEREAKALLLLGDDAARQEVSECPLEEPAKLQPLQFGLLICGQHVEGLGLRGGLGLPDGVAQGLDIEQ